MPSSAVNTFVGMAVDWRRRKPILGNVTGGRRPRDQALGVARVVADRR